MKRIRVPDEILKAAKGFWISYTHHAPTEPDSEFLRRLLETVLRYISEHPQVPTDEQFGKMVNDLRSMNVLAWENETEWNRSKWLCEEWQRRCFVQEEPEIPAEIEDLLWDGVPSADPTQGVDGLHNTLLLAAFRRGVEWALENRSEVGPLAERKEG